ncbi:MAG: TIGR02678 family protein [Acidimicrobiales bacterium]
MTPLASALHLGASPGPAGAAPGQPAPPGPAPASAIGSQLDQETVHQRRRALRALLQHPLLTPEGPHAAEFGLVRRHAGWLRDWLARNPGWALFVDSELARLRKVPADLGDGTRAARARPADPPFTRRRYALWCLALLALEGADRQATLGWIADRVAAAAAADPVLAEAGMTFDLLGADQRRDLVAVVRLLLGLSVLRRVDGDERAYLARQGDVLYSIGRGALARLLAVRQGPSVVEATGLDQRLAAVVAEAVPDTDDARNRRLRANLTRRLLDDPVVYYDELDDDELAYLHRQRSLLVGQVTEATGLVAEVRREGIAMVDDGGQLTDLELPEEGTDGHLTLLLAELLAGAASERPGAAVPMVALHHRTTELIAEHRAHWRKDVTDPGAEVALADQAVDRLAALRLARRGAEGVVPLPAIARYALDPPDLPPHLEDRP